MLPKLRGMGIVTIDGLRGSIPLLVPKLKVLITNLTSDYMSYKLSTICEAFNKSGGGIGRR